MQTGASYEVTELMINTPKEVSIKQLNCGEVGFVAASIKNISDVKVGDTVLYAKYAGTDVKMDGVEYKILSIKDALAIIE